MKLASKGLWLVPLEIEHVARHEALVVSGLAGRGVAPMARPQVVLKTLVNARSGLLHLLCARRAEPTLRDRGFDVGSAALADRDVASAQIRLFVYVESRFNFGAVAFVIVGCLRLTLVWVFAGQVGRSNVEI